MGWTRGGPKRSATRSQWWKIRRNRTRSKSRPKPLHSTGNLFKRVELWILRKLLQRNTEESKCNRFGGLDHKGRLLLCQKPSFHLEPRHHYATEKIYIVAAQHRHCLDWCKDRKINPDDVEYVTSITDLRGISEGEFLFYETAAERLDYPEILAEISSIRSKRGY